MDIENATILVTGASSGIGRATAAAAIEQGARVALIARRADRLHEIADQLGPNALAVPCDVTDPAEVERCVQTILDAFGRIDVLVNNAGRGFYANTDEIDIAEYRALLELNTIAPLAMMQAVLPQMRRQGNGAIVNVSSGATFGALPGAGAYTSSKAALNMLSDVARTELSESGISVSTMYPFVTDTEFYGSVQTGERAAERELETVGSAIHSPERVAEKILGLVRSGERQDDLVPKAFGGSLEA
ncbi:Short-chain dehydrogenase [Kushneria avicenniae]|uniref:Short-chain dehydrogenase n=1 Tax=Kushneria avicenniae TaxID=402385 RepID=A0A1I1MWL2_9GAMM|nr:SDR family oxidoreductase [Kushneria avicenniae]SFC85940.1 Short-chain dehydrogenase [Kushneria avicenniae]